ERRARPAVSLVDLQPDPAGVDQRHPVDGALLGQQVGRDRAQFVVEFAEVAGHQTALGSLGSPRPRSPMMVRWISLAPPATVHSHEPMKSSSHAPDSQPLDIGLTNWV